MARWTRWIAAAVVVVLLAACGSDASENPFAPGNASYNGGYATGGNDSEAPPDATTTSSESDWSGLSGDGETVPEDSTSRTGGYATGGN